MPRKLIQRYMPDHATIKRQKCLNCLGSWLHNPALWHLNRHSVAGAFFVGLSMAFVPVPFQMLLAATLAIIVHVNIPISVALVWLTNPLTMPPMFYFAYKVGQWLMGLPDHPMPFDGFSWSWLMHAFSYIWQPFLLGCAVVGLAAGVLGYLTVRIGWRLAVVYKWRRRHRPRRA